MQSHTDALKTSDTDFNGSATAVVDRIFAISVAKGASDIHFEPQAKGFFVRLRIDGALRTLRELPVSLKPSVTARIKILASLDITEKRLPQDGGIRKKIRDREVDLRISTLPSRYGEKVVIRILDRSSASLNLSRIGLDPVTQSNLEMMVDKPQGILLVTGPTGSGKTTTLYSILNRMKSPMKNIITLENPVEYELLDPSVDETGVTQVQVNLKSGLTFARGLRAALRQDPDVLMVGEIRDKETAEIAMRSALTGHLVLSTLHTNSAPDTVGRLRDIGIEPFLIASTLNGVLAQRLVRTLCEDCRQTYRPPTRTLQSLLGSAPSEALLHRAVGCSNCDGTGYKGRYGIFELMVIDEEMRQLIRDDKNIDILKHELRRRGIKNLRDAGMSLVVEGRTTIEEIYRATIA